MRPVWDVTQPVNVTDEGVTVATDVSPDAIDTTRVVLPVRLHPFLPSPFVGSTYRRVVPSAPPVLSDIPSATTSTVPSRLLLTLSATATTLSARTKNTVMAAISCARIIFALMGLVLSV